jgi:hypothetical protein
MSNDPYNPGNDPYSSPPANWQQQPQYGQPPQYPPTPPYDPAQPYGAGPGQQYPGQSFDPNQQQYPPGQQYDPSQQYAAGAGSQQWQQPGQQYPPPPGPNPYGQPGYPPSPYGAVPPQPPSSGRGLKIALLIIGIVVVLCGGATAIVLVANHKSNSSANGTSTATPRAADTTGGGSTTDSPTGTPESDAAGVKTFAMGDTAQGTAYDGSTFTMKLSGATVKGNDIMVTVDITCTKGSIAYNPLYYTLKGTDGKEYDIDFLGDGTLDAGDLAEGKSVHGTIAFEAPSSQLKGGKVAVTDAVFEVQAYWKLG